MATRQEIVGAARSMVGVPWKHQGRNPTAGVDCVGLVVLTGQLSGVTVYDTANYQRHAKNYDFVTHFVDAGCVAKPIKDRRLGDVLIFNDKTFPAHVGIMADGALGTPHLVHAYALRREVVEEELTSEWAAKLVHCFGFPNVED